MSVIVLVVPLLHMLLHIWSKLDIKSTCWKLMDPQELVTECSLNGSRKFIPIPSIPESLMEKIQFHTCHLKIGPLSMFKLKFFMKEVWKKVTKSAMTQMGKITTVVTNIWLMLMSLITSHITTSTFQLSYWPANDNLSVFFYSKDLNKFIS